MVYKLGFGVCSLGFQVWRRDLGFWGSGFWPKFRAWSLGLRVEGLGLRVQRIARAS